MPGPTMTRGVSGLVGNLKVPFLIQMGTRSPGFKVVSQVEQSPTRGSTNFDLYFTTAMRSSIRSGTAASELAMEKARGLIGGNKSNRYSNGMLGTALSWKSSRTSSMFLRGRLQYS